MVMPQEAGRGQRLDDVPGVLLLPVDRGRPRPRHGLGKGAGARPQRDLVRGKAEFHARDPTPQGAGFRDDGVPARGSRQSTS